MPTKKDGTPVRDAKFCVYHKRMQKRIEREIKMLDWIAEHYPELFLDEGREISDASGKIQSNRRLKQLLTVITKLKPRMEVEMVLKRLDSPD